MAAMKRPLHTSHYAAGPPPLPTVVEHMRSTSPDFVDYRPPKKKFKDAHRLFNNEGMRCCGQLNVAYFLNKIRMWFSRSCVRWKPRVSLMPTLSSLIAPEVVVMTTYVSSWHHDNCLCTITYQDICPQIWRFGGRINIRLSYYQYRNSHYKDKTVSLPSYHYNGNPMLGKKVFILKLISCVLLWFEPIDLTIYTRAPSQYKDRLIYVWRFPC